MEFTPDWNWIIDIGLKAIGIGISLWTLRIAYRIFRNQDIKKEFRKEQFKKVVNLLNDFENLWLHFSIYKGREFVTAFYTNAGNIPVILKTDHFLNDDVTQGLKVGINFTDPNDNFFTKYSNDVFVPKSIANKITQLQPYISVMDVMHTDDLTPSENIILINFMSESKKKTDLKEYFETINPAYVSADIFLNEMMRLKKTATDWLEKYGIDDFNVRPIRINHP